jgi:anti-anti-sigma factor
MAPQSHLGWLEVEQIGQVTVAKFNARYILEEEKVQSVGKQLLSLGEQVGPRRLVLNFDAVERLSTEMLGKLIALHKRIEAKGGRLALCNVKPQLYEILKILKLPQILSIYADEEEALQEF